MSGLRAQLRDIYRSIRRTINDRSHQPKIFGLGLSRTGTTSLTDALQDMGFNVIHYPGDRHTMEEVERGQGKLTILKEYDGITDIVTIPVYKALDRHYKDAKFVLTVRDKESWLESIEKLLLREPPEREPALLRDRPKFAHFKRFLRESVYGTNTFDHAAMSESYDAHHEEVRAYFKGRADDFLELDIIGGDPMEKLSDFIGRGRPLQGPFPKSNAAPPETQDETP